MSYIDLQTALRNWQYDPDRISVRKIRGGDGRLKVQMRVELGIMQMEVDGRPDGQRPLGHESLLSYHRHRLMDFERRNGVSLGFALTPEQCSELRAEASLFYRRFVAEFVLEEFAEVIRDTSHNLAIFDFCRDHALEQSDRTLLESFRPYVTMMNARARAHQAMQENNPRSAIAHVNRGIAHIRAFLDGRMEPETIEQSEDLKILRSLAAELRSQQRDSETSSARPSIAPNNGPTADTPGLPTPLPPGGGAATMDPPGAEADGWVEPAPPRPGPDAGV